MIFCLFLKNKRIIINFLTHYFVCLFGSNSILGCKIKALRAKTNTYIKTPVRGEEPVFVVTGRKEDVNAAKREILSAAEHFSQIRAQRKNSLVGGGIVGLNGSNGQPLPGQCTIKVRVPYRVVGLVVGPKGATIKRIQQETSTYIITPSRDKEPVFEVTGLPESVKKARFEIEAHIANRTGGQIDTAGSGVTAAAAESSSSGSPDVNIDDIIERESRRSTSSRDSRLKEILTTQMIHTLSKLRFRSYHSLRMSTKSDLDVDASFDLNGEPY